MTGSDICNQGGRTRNWGVMLGSVSAGFGTLLYAFPYEETEIFAKALAFMSVTIFVYTYWDNWSRKSIRDDELADD